MFIVSACLMGYPCRYDGCSKRHSGLAEKLGKGQPVPVCPEVLGGLGIPRPPAEIRASSHDRRVITRDGRDVTSQFETGARIALALAFQFGCTLAVLKTRSPSCGVGFVYDGTFTRTQVVGDGVTASLFMKHGISLLPLDGDLP